MDRKGQSYMIKRKNDSSIYRRHPDNLKIFKVQFEPQIQQLHKGHRIIVLCCAIWYHLYNLKNVKNTHRGVLILVKLQASACKETVGKGGEHFFNSLLPPPPASQTLRHYPDDYCRELTSAHR